ncbi:MAG: hypothetical protein ACE5JK_00260 [Candidatus Omnitrophota bacterium]
MYILGFAIKVVVSTFIIWLSIAIVDRGNYRNSIRNALVTAVILNFAGLMPFFLLFGLVIWVFILINWYSIGFFKSFLCVFVYGAIYFFLNLFIATALVSGTFVVEKMTDVSMYARKWKEIRQNASAFFTRFPEYLPFRGKYARTQTFEVDGKEFLFRKNMRFYLKNGNVIEARILMEGKRGLLIDIAEGRSEVVIRKDSIDRIEEF